MNTDIGKFLKPTYFCDCDNSLVKEKANAIDRLLSIDSEGLIFEIVKNPFRSSQKVSLLEKIKILTREVRGNFDFLIENLWFPRADMCIFFENGKGESVAYSLGGWLEICGAKL